MRPDSLEAGQFAAYPPLARERAVADVSLFRKLPLSFLPSLLLNLSDYDFRFPEERRAIDSELAVLRSLSPGQLDEWFAPFAKLSVSGKLKRLDWVSHPAVFLEDESAWLWTTGQQDAFRAAAMEYGSRLEKEIPSVTLPIPRLGIAVIGQGVASWSAPLFRNLRPHGTFFGQVRPENGLQILLAAVEQRAAAHPVPYGHWYVDGGEPVTHGSHLTCVSYARLKPVRRRLLQYMQKEIDRPGMGPEQLRSDLARLRPEDLGMSANGDAVLDRFQLKVLTEGSGTQIFSTTFAQWTAREALRRAQPLSLLVRFAPRQRQRPMNEMLADGKAAPEIDPVGSLIDADMGAWYNWIDQQRLAGYEQSVFIAWFEGHQQALVIAPTLPRGTESSTAMGMEKLIFFALG
jgi:hypothetical protein